MSQASPVKAAGKKRIQYFVYLGALVVLASFIDSHNVSAKSPSSPSSVRSRLDPAKEAAYIKKASDLDDNPAEHLEPDARTYAPCVVFILLRSLLTTPRSSVRWEQLFEQMSSYGASPTDEQVDEIVRYFQRNLTIINVNTSRPRSWRELFRSRMRLQMRLLFGPPRKNFMALQISPRCLESDNIVLEKLKGRLQF